MDDTEIQQALLNAKLIIADLTMQLYEARGANFNLNQQLGNATELLEDCRAAGLKSGVKKGIPKKVKK